MFFPPAPVFFVLLGLAEQWAACQMGKRHLPILGVFEPKPVAITKAHKLVQDDGTEEGAISLQHASGEQLQPGRVVGIQGSDLLQDLARNPHRTHVSTGNSARASESLGKPQEEQGTFISQASHIRGLEGYSVPCSPELGLKQVNITPRASQLQEEQSTQRHGSLAPGQDIFIHAV